MVITSKYNTKCNACGCRVNVGEQIEWVRNVQGARHATVAQCTDAKTKRAAATVPDALTLNLKPIAEFLRGAQARGLKSPKLRVLGVDGRTEVRMGLTKQGAAPGSISVVVGGTYVGSIRPNDAVVGQLAQDIELQKHLLIVAKDPVTAAKEYAALMGLCSFCGLQLTDEGSVEVGYGPICAKHWGLPHTPKGTPKLHTVPSVTL